MIPLGLTLGLPAVLAIAGWLHPIGRARLLLALVLIVELALMVWLPPSALTILGSQATLDPTGRLLLGTGTLVVAINLLATAPEPPLLESPAIGLGCLAGLALAAALSNELVVVVLATGLTAIGALGQLAPATTSPTARAAGHRLLTWTIVATTVLLISAAFDRLFLAQGVPGLVTPAAALFAIGLLIELGAFPFWFWLPGLCDAAPAVAALVVGLLGCLVGAALQGTDGFGPLLPQYLSSRSALLIGAELSAVLSAVMALGERRPTRVLAFVISAHANLVLAGLASGLSLAVPVATWSLAGHGLAAALALGCLARIQRGNPPVDGTATLSGLLWRRPALAVALVIALLSLANLPPTVGFAGLRTVATGLGGQGPLLLLGLILPVVLSTGAVLRTVAPIAARTSTPGEQSQPGDLLIAGVALLLVLNGVIPTLWQLVIQ